MSTCDRPQSKICTFRNNLYSFSDNFLISEPTTGEFYTISAEKTNYGVYNSEKLGTINILLDNQIITHERRVYNFFDVISDVGGIYEVIKTCILVFMGMYTNKLYNFYTVNHINHKYLEPIIMDQAARQKRNNRRVMANEDESNKEEEVGFIISQQLHMHHQI